MKIDRIGIELCRREFYDQTTLIQVLRTRFDILELSLKLEFSDITTIKCNFQNYP